MPGLAQRNYQSSNATSSYYSLSTNNGSVSSNGFWSKHGVDISYDQLQKFWSELPPHARQELLRIDKHTLFEQARKNMYCSRCNGLLLEGFLQIVMYGKSLQRNTTRGQLVCSKSRVLKDQINNEFNEDSANQDEAQDPSVHPWGGLTTTRDGALTLLDYYLYAKSLKGLQTVFDSARARERERELLYPDACGGGGRGWISQGMTSYGRGHGTRETCALHSARLSCDMLVDFWSALGEETRQSLLRMKEEDFIERLMYRFDSKRFCRDCRRNVIREFKELKELKRMRREPRCTTWFCVADTAFQYEVSNNAIHADWHQAFIDSIGTYRYFEWAIGTGEGKSDILDFENVGMNGSVRVNGLDLGGLSACYITLRAWKPDGRCTELSVKAHALKGQRCVHCRLMVGDGYVTISQGESIRRFFEHAEEAEEEEDDDSLDKDGNEFDGECSRPQKHAKSPELAREFLLDAATVIFKEQVEKAFREGTARQNAHSIFVCLALKLLEERVHVACKEIATLEKQMKLLEEEEKEKREEEERKERKRTKEREKKLRRKERLRGKEKEKTCTESNQNSTLPDANEEVSFPCVNVDASITMEELANANTLSSPPSYVQDELTGNDDMASYAPSNNFDNPEEGHAILKDEHDSFTVENSKISHRKMKLQREAQLDSSKKWPERRQSMENGSMAYKSESRYCDDNSECSSRRTCALNRQPRSSPAKFNLRNSNSRFNQKLQCSTNRIVDRSDLKSCGCNQQNDYRAKAEPHAFGTRVNRENRSVNKIESSDLSKPVHRGSKSNQSEYYIIRDTCGRSRSGKTSTNLFGRESLHTKKVWEPIEARKRYPRSNSDSDVILRSTFCNVVDGTDPDKSGAEMCSSKAGKKSVATVNVGKKLVESRTLYDSKENDLNLTRSCKSNKSPNFSASSSSSSDNCCSCLSEGDSNTASSRLPIMGSSSTSDSEDGSQLSEGGKDASMCVKTSFSESDCGVAPTENVQVIADVDKVASSMSTSVFSIENSGNLPWSPFAKPSSQESVNETIARNLGPLYHTPLPQIHTQQNNIRYPTFQAPTTMDYYHQNQPVSWPTSPANGFVPYAHPPSHYLLTSPYGYGLSGGDSPFCMQYSAVQHLPSPPVLNPTHVPFYQPVLHADGSHFLDQTSVLIKPNGAMDPSCGEGGREKAVPAGHQSPKEAPPASRAVSGNTGFSLFKFGGPMALSAYKPSSNSSDKGVCGDLLSSDSLTVQVDGKNTCCGKKDANIEEYNLFATSKGIKFSIF